eukprot:142250_1
MHFSLIFVLLFHTQSSYFLGPDPLIFSEAEAYCVSQSSHLASVHSSAEFYEARSLCETVTNPEACWTGLERVGTSNVWTYTDGSALDFGFDASGSGVAIQGQKPPWISSDPQPCCSSEPCVEFLGFASSQFWDFYWNDRRCDHANYPICNNISNTTSNPTFDPTAIPTFDPTIDPTLYPTLNPTTITGSPTDYPTFDPTLIPTVDPTIATINPTLYPTLNPTTRTGSPTGHPTEYTQTTTQTSDTDSYDSEDVDIDDDSYDSDDSDTDDDSYDFAAGNGDFMDLHDLLKENADDTLYFDVDMSSYTWAHLWCAMLVFVVSSVTTIWCVNRKCQS